MSAAQIAARKLASFWRLPGFIKLALLPTWVLLGLARLLVLCLPFQTLAPKLGQHVGTCVFIPLIPAHLLGRARLIARLIRTTAQYCPWQANCFAQAIAARVWLKVFGIPYALYFGLCKNATQQLSAHAWVCSGPVFVSGGNSFAQFTVVGTFVSDAGMMGLT